jgi:hypothetical protein
LSKKSLYAYKLYKFTKSIHLFLSLYFGVTAGEFKCFQIIRVAAYCNVPNNCHQTYSSTTTSRAFIKLPCLAIILIIIVIIAISRLRCHYLNYIKNSSFLKESNRGSNRVQTVVFIWLLRD